MQGAFSVWYDHKKGLRDLRLKPAQRHLFLYEKMLMFTKRTGKDTDRSTYHFKNALKVKLMLISIEHLLKLNQSTKEKQKHAIP